MCQRQREPSTPPVIHQLHHPDRATLKATRFVFTAWARRQGLEHRLLGVERIGLRAEAAGSGARGVEVPAESGSQEGAEDDLGTPRLLLVSALDRDMEGNHLLEGGQGQPKEEHKLEGVVEGEPVHDADKALNDAIARLVCLLGAHNPKQLLREEGKDNPVL